MTIIEAIKSGKRFRRPCFASGQLASYSPGWIEVKMHKDWCMYVSPVDILADDWEVEEKKVEITRAQLEAAYCSALNNPSLPKFLNSSTMVLLMAKELGLE